MNTLLYGMELEFVSPYDIHFTARHELVRSMGLKHSPFSVVDGAGISFGTDASSASGKIGYHGYEMRTIQPWSDFPEKEVNAMLKIIALTKGQITQEAGLHFHFSGIPLTGEQQIKLRNILNGYNTWQSRSQWVKKTATNLTDKYSSLRIVSQDEHHYEARIFNASKKFRAIHQNWRWLNKQLENIMNAPPVLA